MRIAEATFARSALDSVLGVWNIPGMQQLALLSAPDDVLGCRRELLRGDIHYAWAVWFAESVADPDRYLASEPSYSQIFFDALTSLRSTVRMTDPELQFLAEVIAKYVYDRVVAVRRRLVRRAFSRNEKISLLDAAGSPPRCYLCGALFDKAVVSAFLEGNQGSIQAPLMLDVLRGKGLQQRDFRIEIDHVLALASGGDDESLRLACGWCNRHKSNYGAIYDVNGAPRRPRTPTLSHYSLPRPFWTVRVLALVQHCEHGLGCSNTVDNSELTIAPVSSGGAMNPSNLQVTCLEHDPLGTDRFLPASEVSLLWAR